MEQSQAGKDKKLKIKAKHIQNTHGHTHTQIHTYTPAHTLGKLDKNKVKIYAKQRQKNLLGRKIETQYKSTLLYTQRECREGGIPGANQTIGILLLIMKFIRSENEFLSAFCLIPRRSRLK